MLILSSIPQDIGLSRADGLCNTIVEVRHETCQNTLSSLVDLFFHRRVIIINLEDPGDAYGIKTTLFVYSQQLLG